MKCCVDNASWQVVVEEATGERRVIAKRKINIGEEIMQNVATLALLRYEYVSRRCFGCLRASDKLLRCGSCHVIFFCSKNCQVTDWKSYHKRECKFVPNLVDHFRDDPDCIDDVLLLSRALIEQPNEKSCRYVNGSAIICGEDHIRSLSLGNNGKMYADNTIRVIQQVSLLSKKPISDIAKLYTQFKCNNFGILDDLLKCYAAGVFPAAALLNHSCDPNCVLQFNENNSLRIIAVKEIAIDEEITHSYTDLSLPTEGRRNKLRSVYGFECQCCRCASGTNISPASRASLLSLLEEAVTDPLRIRDILSNNKITNTEVEHLITATYSTDKIHEVVITEVAKLIDQSKRVSLIDENNKDATQLLERALQLLQGVFRPLNFEIYKVKALIFHLYLLEGAYYDAISTCKYLCSFLLICFSQIGYHPLLGLQLFTLSDLCKLVSHDYDWDSTYRWASSIISITHHPTSAMHNRLLEIVQSLSKAVANNSTPVAVTLRPTDRIRGQRRLTLCNSLLRALYRGRHGKNISNKVRQDKSGSLTEESDKALTYGEVVCASFLQILKLIHNHISLQQTRASDNYTFIDLGSGTGKACMTAAFEPNEMFTQIYGLEIMSELVDVAQEVRDNLISTMSLIQAAPAKCHSVDTTDNTEDDTRNEDFVFLVEKIKHIVQMNSFGITVSALADTLGKLLGAKLYKSKITKPYHKYSNFIQHLESKASHIFTFQDNRITIKENIEQSTSEEEVPAVTGSCDDDYSKEYLTDVLRADNIATLLPLPAINFITCDIFNISSNNLHDVIHADVNKTIIYCANLLFSPAMIEQLTVIIAKSLAEGSYFISLKPISSMRLQLIEESFFQMSWQKAKVYIYAVK